ncbi:hypothetical protein WH367_00160 [Comamonas sp. MYb21]|uniref:hypothetical protein n=1 Tax=Comamonas sp. MYb21 TaxID=1848648 RepID=UPI003095C5E5
MDLDEKIESLRSEIRCLKAEQDLKITELNSLFLDKAKNTCPISIGETVEIEAGKKGIVEEIGFDVEFFKMIEENEPIHWNVSGKRINKSGETGLRHFKKIGPRNYIVNGLTFKKKSIAQHLGIMGDDED